MARKIIDFDFDASGQHPWQVDLLKQALVHFVACSEPGCKKCLKELLSSQVS